MLGALVVLGSAPVWGQNAELEQTEVRTPTAPEEKPPSSYNFAAARSLLPELPEPPGDAGPPVPPSTRNVLDLEYNFCYTQGMKTAISVPNDLFQAAEETARRLGLNRSELYQRAMAEYLHHHGDAGITDALNTVYGTEASGVDPVLGQMQKASLPQNEW